MTLARRIGTGLTLNSQYTFSRSFGNTSGSNEARTAAVPNDFEADRGYNNFDVRHTFNFSALYSLPSGTGKHDLGSIGERTTTPFGPIFQTVALISPHPKYLAPVQTDVTSLV